MKPLRIDTNFLGPALRRAAVEYKRAADHTFFNDAPLIERATWCKLAADALECDYERLELDGDDLVVYPRPRRAPNPA